jgi:prevent-host-death family protein
MCYGHPMERIGVRDLRNHASGVVRRARAGERLIITVDGVPAAEIGPIRDEAAATSIEQLISAGALLPARTRTAPAPPQPIPSPSKVSTADVLDRLRAR